MACNRSTHLILQVTPPLLLLWPATSRHGPALHLAGALFWPVLLVSLARIAYLLSQPGRPYRRLYRPVLAAEICMLALLHTHLSLRAARTFAETTAATVQARCEAQKECPRTLEGWQLRDDAYASQTATGTWVRWRLLYRSDGNRFTIQLYMGPDVGESWSGGTQIQALGPKT